MNNALESALGSAAGRITDWTECEAAVMALCKARAERERLQAACEKRLAAIRAGFADETDGLDAAIKAAEKAVETFAEGQRMEFGESRSKVLNSGARIGWRMGKPALKPRPKWTFERVLATLLSGKKWASTFVRSRQDVDKEAIHAALDRGKIDEADLTAMGLRLVQKEGFYVEAGVTGDGK